MAVNIGVDLGWHGIVLGMIWYDMVLVGDGMGCRDGMGWYVMVWHGMALKGSNV